MGTFSISFEFEMTLKQKSLVNIKSAQMLIQTMTRIYLLVEISKSGANITCFQMLYYVHTYSAISLQLGANI